MVNENSHLGNIIVFSVIFLLIGGVVGYFIGEKSAKNNFRNNGMDFPNTFSQINESVKAEIESFFESNPTTDEINSYCQKNQMYCMEYCRTINPSDIICESLNFINPRGA